jgi:hypothetical protein
MPAEKRLRSIPPEQVPDVARGVAFGDEQLDIERFENNLLAIDRLESG